jgi:hypothetical protein
MPTRPARRPLALFVCLTFGFALLIGGLASHAADEVAKDGKPLFNGKDLAGWKMKDEGGAKAWSVVGDVKLDPADPAKLVGSGKGESADKGVLFRGPIDHGSDIFTEQAFGDCELHVEFVVPKGSNSGVYLMGQYEIQIFDSHGKKEIGPGDLGSIYSVAVAKENAAKAPGEWQTLDVVFKAPRFDANGKKTENASFVLVKLNGKTIHENVPVPNSTGGALAGGEQAKGPLMFQGDHGIVAYRNIRLKEIAFRGDAK